MPATGITEAISSACVITAAGGAITMMVPAVMDMVIINIMVVDMVMVIMGVTGGRNNGYSELMLCTYSR